MKKTLVIMLLLLTRSLFAQSLTPAQQERIKQLSQADTNSLSGTLLIEQSVAPSKIVGTAITASTPLQGDVTGTIGATIESDPLASASPAFAISQTEIDAWNAIAGTAITVLPENPYTNSFYFTNAFIPVYSSVTNSSTLGTNVMHFWYGLFSSNQVNP